MCFVCPALSAFWNFSRKANNNGEVVTGFDETPISLYFLSRHKVVRLRLKLKLTSFVTLLNIDISERFGNDEPMRNSTVVDMQHAR
jgi:hypothetical protein